MKVTIKSKLRDFEKVEDLKDGSLVWFSAHPGTVYMKVSDFNDRENIFLLDMKNGQLHTSWTNKWIEVDGELVV